LIDCSLFRPRFLIEVSERVLSAALNRGHNFVEEADVQHAMKEMSLYLVSDFANEMRNFAGTPAEIFYAFIGAKPLLTHEEVIERISKKLPELDLEFVIDLLIWYGFLGIVANSGKPVFIYERAYDFARLVAERPAVVSERLYVVNEAFIRGLEEG